MIADFLNNVDSNRSFYLGEEKLKNLSELLSAIDNMDEKSFALYVNQSKNDFCNWIENVVGDHKLAREIRNLKSPKNISARIKRRVSHLQKTKLGLFSEHLEVKLSFYSEEVRLILDKEKCISCDICKEICPQEAIEVTNTVANIDKSKCSLCGLCVPFCPVDAIKLLIKGKEELLLDKVLPKLPEMTDINGFRIKKLFTGNITAKNQCPLECEDCISACPLLLITKNGDSININKADCVLCGACKVSCPKNLIEIKRSCIIKQGDEFSGAWSLIIRKLLGDQKANQYLSDKSRKSIMSLINNSDIKTYLDKNDKIKK